MKRIAYTNPDGSVSICCPCISEDDPEGMTEDDALQRALQKDIPPTAQNVTVIEPTAIPSDRSKRYAWRIKNGVIVVDPTIAPPHAQARAERIDQLRAKRKAGEKLTADEKDELMDLLLGL